MIETNIHFTRLLGTREQLMDEAWFWWLAFRYYLQDNDGEVDRKSAYIFIREYYDKISPPNHPNYPEYDVNIITGGDLPKDSDIVIKYKDGELSYPEWRR
jgi:hypothetical protein